MNTNTFGAEWHWNATDYKLNPRKGFSLLINGNAGIRTINKNTSIENLYDASSSRKFAYLYDSIALRSYKYTSTIAINYFVPITKRFTSRFAYSGGIVYNPNLFRNELFQIGGYRLLRGFDEASLFVNQYHVAMVEPRYLLSQNSYLFAFADVALLNSKYIDNNKLKNGLGLGAGISLETRNGMFNFMYALGNNLGGGIQFRNSKIHFGYVNTF
jgi:hemolysin activation/secretion protein